MSVFQFVDYKLFLREWISQQPKQGYGEFRKIANHLGVSSTMVSQVFQSDKDFSLELACELTEYLGLNDLEEQYFLLLVELSRAGSHKLKEKLKKQIRERQELSKKISERVRKDRELSSADSAIYYSSWVYTAIRNLTAIPETWTADRLASHLQIPQKLVREVLDFLLDRGLIEMAEGNYRPAVKATHLGADHPLVIKHHQNWRLRGMQKMDLKSPDNTFYTGPLSLSKAGAEDVRLIIVDTISRINKLVIDSDSETARCLNIDWFEY